MSCRKLNMPARVVAILMVAICMIVGPAHCARERGGGAMRHIMPSRHNQVPRAHIEPVEYKVNMILLNRLQYIAGSVDILVKFAGPPTPPPLPPHGANLHYKHKINSVLTMFRNRANTRESKISMSLNKCFDVRSVEMVYAKSLDDLKRRGGGATEIETKFHHDTRRQRLEILPDFNWFMGVPSSGVAKITIRYQDTAGQTNCERAPMLITQGVAVLKPDRCSEIMPCFDDSNLNSKAEISLELTIDSPGKTKILTNLPQADEPELIRLGDDYLMTQKFKSTPEPIAVDELVFISGCFDEPLVGSRTRLLTPLGRKADAKFAFELMERAFDWCESYADYKHPLDSFQLVTVPTVPEEWVGVRGLGLSTILPILALIDADSRDIKIGVAVQIGYEVASQWFGVIVKPRDKSDNWITEGLAAYTALKMIDSLMPDLQIYDYFRSTVSPLLKDIDSRGKFPPVTTANTEHLNHDFHSVRPFKSAAIIDMLARDVVRNPAKFDAMVRDLIEKSAMKNGVSLEHLTYSFANRRFAQAQIEELLEPWIDGAGYPVVHVSADQQTGQVCLVQSGDQDNATTVWPLSFIVGIGSGASDSPYLEKRIDLVEFAENSGTICLPSSFSMLPGSGAWLRISSRSRDAIEYFKVVPEGMLADEQGRLRLITESTSESFAGSASEGAQEEAQERAQEEASHLGNSTPAEIDKATVPGKDSAQSLDDQEPKLAAEPHEIAAGIRDDPELTAH